MGQHSWRRAHQDDEVLAAVRGLGIERDPGLLTRAEADTLSHDHNGDNLKGDHDE